MISQLELEFSDKIEIVYSIINDAGYINIRKLDISDLSDIWVKQIFLSIIEL